MPKLTKKNAAALTLDEIRVTPFNFTPHHRTFTVSGISDHINPEIFNTSEALIVGGKEAKHLLLLSTRLKVKSMTQIHPVLRATRMVLSASKIVESLIALDDRWDLSVSSTSPGISLFYIAWERKSLELFCF
ncbi:hypothetical protein Bca52824_064267 [Brassica carinata]|uniref:Uncharacterized protein n=1 Tax=Brassica carinata TaxID=52824 RepID=A0A8X7QI24_BRACI|nr:hypothetical protein Bca52824_064267 [Brassica carinata]